MSVRVAVVGFGQLAQQVVVPLLKRSSNATLAGIVDPDPDARARATAAAPDVPVLQSIESLVELVQFDGAVIASPPAHHSDSACFFLRQGVAVYVEKPLAHRREDAERLVRTWQTTETIGMVGHNYRFNRLFGELKDEVSSGNLGEVIAIRSLFSTDLVIAARRQFGVEEGGGPLLDLGAHHFDMIGWVTGEEIQEVLVPKGTSGGVIRKAPVEFRLGSGVLCQSLFIQGGPIEDRIEIIGTSGSAIVDRFRGVRIDRRPARRSLRDHLDPVLSTVLLPLNVHHLIRRLRSPWLEPSFERALGHFGSAILGQTPATPDLMDGWRSFCVAEAAQLSEREGQPAQVDYTLPGEVPPE